MRVNLIYPAERDRLALVYPPLGLSYIAAILDREGYNIELYDFTFIKEIEDVDEEIYAFSLTTSQCNLALKIAKDIKNKNKNALIVFGGPHPSVMPEETLRNKEVDVVVIGEGEYTFLDLVKAYESKKNFKGIDGLWYKEKGKIIKNSLREDIKNLDELPIAKQDIFPLDRYFKENGYRELSIMTSRGCNGNCDFCQPALRCIFGNRVKFRDPKKVVDEIEYLVKAYKLDMFVISDDNFVSNKEHVVKLCKLLIKRNLPIIWRCQSRIDVDRETLRLMKRAGCFLIQLGVESGSQKILNSMRKGIKIEQIKKVFEDCKNIGILTHAYVMVGNLEETDETIRETAGLLKVIKPFSIHVTITTPYPGTDLYDYSLKNNLLLTKEWNKFDHHAFDHNRVSTLKLRDFSSEKILNLKKELEDLSREVSTRYKDIFRMFFDFDFSLILFKMIVKDPFLIKRMLILVLKEDYYHSR